MIVIEICAQRLDSSIFLENNFVRDSGDHSDHLDEVGALAYGVDGHHDRVVPT